MRLSSVGYGITGLLCAGVAALASPAISNELLLPLAGGISNYAPADDKSGSVPEIARGQALGVACADVDQTGADVRVVMQVTQSRDDEPTGFDNVLATEQKVEHGKVHVRVPDLPDLSHHTVTVKVYVTGAHGTHMCDAGRVRIV
jgi:hypothetical protein